MHVRALRYFVAVAEEGHFGRAAARLHVAQPSVSQAIRRLEAQVGRELLDHSGRRVTVTAEGQRVLAEGARRARAPRRCGWGRPIRWRRSTSSPSRP